MATRPNSKPIQKQVRRLEVFMPAVRELLIARWWETQNPVRASLCDAEIRSQLSLGIKSNPSGWWGRAWTACEAIAAGKATSDAWMQQFKPLFEGLGRVSSKQPYFYEVTETWRCPPHARVERQLADTLLDLGTASASPLVRRAIELAGMRAAREWLLKQGFTADEIFDTSATRSWDYEARRNGQVVMFVEAKGLLGPWTRTSTVYVTQNEVENARQHPDSCALVIAASCTVAERADGNLVAKARTTKVEFPWRPDSGTLTPRVLSHRPGQLKTR